MASSSLPMPIELEARADGLCAVEGCSKPRKGTRVCAMHYWRWRARASFDLPPKLGPRHCFVEGCDREVKATKGGRGLCGLHYQRWRKHGQDGVDCAVEGCGLNVVARGLCATHYAQFQRSGRVQALPSPNRKCSMDGCDRPHLALGYCRMHYERWQFNGDAAITQRLHGRGSISVYGYKRIPGNGHPNAYPNGQIAEHRFVMSQMLGRPLVPEEIVHHRNGNRLDNRPENLELWVKSHSPGQRVEELLAWAELIIERYRPVVHQLKLFEETPVMSEGDA